VSLILDALRRADSERERGAVPGLHAQPLPAFTGDALPPTGTRLWQAIAIVAGAGLLAALAWGIVDRAPPRQAAVPAVTRPAVASTLTAPPPPPPVAPYSPGDVATAPPVAAPPRASLIEAQPVAEPAPWPAQESRKAAALDSAAVRPAVGPEAKAVPPSIVMPTEAPITPRGELPDSIRAQLPPLAVGGSIYSASAPDRSVIIDGRIYREKDRLTADLSLEQIRPRSVVLLYKSYRFEIGL